MHPLPSYTADDSLIHPRIPRRPGHRARNPISPPDYRKHLRDRYRTLRGKGVQKRFLTRSQSAAVSLISESFRAKERCHQLIGFRAQPLLVGLSGSGKTHAVFEAARLLDKPILALSVGTWMVEGSHTERPTLALIRDQVRQSKGCLILIDEIDKLSARLTQESGWFALLMTEVFMLLDQSDHLRQAAGWTEDDLSLLRARSMVVGAGAWQLSLLGASQHIGFRNAVEIPAQAAVERSRVIPDEVLFRFSPEMAVVSPPSTIELAKGLQVVRGNLGLKSLSLKEVLQEARSFQEMGRGLRALEAYALKLAKEAPSRRPLPMPSGAPSAECAPVARKALLFPEELFRDGADGADELARCMYELGLEGFPGRREWPILMEAKRIVAGFRRLPFHELDTDIDGLRSSLQVIRRWLISTPYPRRSARTRVLTASAMAAVARLSALLDIYSEGKK